MEIRDPSSARTTLNMLFSGRVQSDELERALDLANKGQGVELARILARCVPAADVVGRMILDHSQEEDAVESIWSQPLALLVQMSCAANLYGSRFLKQTQSASDGGMTKVLEVLIRLYGRVCRTGREVIGLLRAGYPEGAMTRWRLMHEAAVVAMFVAKHGEDAAKSYSSHEVIEACEYMASYEPYAKKHGLKRYSSEERRALKTRRGEVMKDKKKDYCSNWGWAIDWVANPSFEKIARDVNMFDDYECLYKMANHTTHPTARTLSFAVGQSSPDAILSGPTAYGLGIPLQCAARSLLASTLVLNQTKRSLEGDLIRGIMYHWLEEIEHACVRVESSLTRA